MQIVKGIEMLGGVESEPNIYLIDGEVLVDTGTGAFFSQVKEEIERSYERYKIRTIVNTHYHHDHTGGDKKFRDWLKAEIHVHAQDKDFIESGRTLAERFGDVPKIVTVDKTLREGSIIKTKNFVFQVLHTPGHTPGSICLYEFNKKILISGDTIFEDSIGRWDLPGGNRDKLLASLNKLLPYNVQYLLPGHGPPKVGGFAFLLKQSIAHFGSSQATAYP